MSPPEQSHKPALSSVVTSRAQTASNVLNELERLHSFEHHNNDFGIAANEESVDLNMDLFEELADIEYTPSLLSSPEESKPFEVPSSQPLPAPVVVSTPQQPHLINVSSLAAAMTNNDTVKLSAEFKSIVESLTPSLATVPINNVIATNTFENLIQITGIPTTTVVGDECLVPVEFVGRASSISGTGDAETMDLDGIVISNEMEFINERDLFSLEELSAELVAEESNHSTTKGSVNNAMLVNGVLPQWAKGMTIPLDNLDYELSKNDETLNALLKGDVPAAKSCISSPAYVQEAFSPVSNFSSEDDETNMMEEDAAVEVIETTKPAAPVKQERRGRKPAKAYKDPLTYVRDKALRKKEQNKTAATRYRQKKKQELNVTLTEEEELQKVHDDLDKERESVAGELRIIRALLRQMLEVRRKKKTPSPSGVTASSLVQAQKVANRRK
ncbi:Activating transcription factor of chaperone [Orchesella cincta]|uniref:Activating transcription factor of chaperone n=1 Tax=Orchesella cincta TaxID=48709 RepID=A0A1D2MP32_ORCCI|nr:Activating transcription factor of chaperone [Orchesella cincta]